MIEVTFPTLNPFVLRDMRRAAVRNAWIDGLGRLYMPRGPVSRRPAVVVLEGLGGLKPSRELSYGEHLALHGYVTLVVDSFRARDARQASHTRRALRVTEAMMLADAFAGLRYLGGHPAVDPDAVSVMGFSYGGMIATLAAHEQISRIFAPEGRRFAGHVSYYGCSVPRLELPRTTGAPVLMMIGALDRNVSIRRSREIAGDLRDGGSDVGLRVFEGAYHQWDSEKEKPHFVRFALADCRMLVERDDHIRDLRTGMRITGPLSRAYAIARSVSLRGYRIQRDEAVLRQSTDALHDFLARVSKGAGRSRRRRSA